MSKRRGAAFVEPAQDGEVEAGERASALELTTGVTSGYRIDEEASPPRAAELGAVRPARGRSR
jgi:hypothetical protein